MHDYTPEQNRRQAGIISALLFAAAAVCLLCQNYVPLPRIAMQLAAIAALVSGIQITTRYALTTYTYAVSSEAVNTFEDEMNRVGEVSGEDNSLWLKIARAQGKSSRVIGGFPLSSVEMCIKGGRGELKMKLGNKYSDIKHCYNYCNRIFPENPCIAVVVINGEKLAVTLEPDGIIADLLKTEQNG